MPLLTASIAGKNQCPSFDWLQGWHEFSRPITECLKLSVSTTLNCGIKKGEGEGEGEGGRNSNTNILSILKTIATFQKVTWAIFYFLLQLPLLMPLKIVKIALFIVLYNINSSCKNLSVLPSNWHKFQANCDKNRPTAFIVDMENKRSHCR